MGAVRFLQVSDLHLGRPFGWLPPEARERRRREQRRVLEQAVLQARERGVHAILLPGDLFDLEGVDVDTLQFALHAFRAPGCPPVFIAPGNHDPAAADSLYWNPRLLGARGLAWPGHVHVFTTPEWSARALPGVDDVRIWGRCATSGIDTLERPLAPAAVAGLAAGASALEVAVVHGSREGGCPAGQRVTAPFSDAEALASPFDYLAVGHYHAPSHLTADGARTCGVRLAYAGSAAALDATEVGAHGALEVRIERGVGPPAVEIEAIELDRQRVYAVDVDATEAGAAETLDRRIERALDAAGASEHDLVTVRLTGRLARGVRYPGPGPETRARVFHLRVAAGALRPDYDLDAYRAGGSGTTEERFVRILLERLDAEHDPERRATLLGAIYHGLDAFRLGEVVPGYEEIET